MGHGFVLWFLGTEEHLVCINRFSVRLRGQMLSDSAISFQYHE